MQTRPAYARPDPMRTPGFALRPAAPTDRDFLFALHRETLRPFIEQIWGWDEAWQQQDFDTGLSEHSPWIIERDGAPIGGVLLEWTADSLYLHLLELRPEHQGQGVGSAVLRHLIALATARGLSVALSVLEPNLRARELYERHGFVVTAIEPPFVRMRREPS